MTKTGSGFFLSKSKIFSWACVFFAIGIFLASWLAVEILWAYLAIGVSALGFVFGNRQAQISALFLFIMALGAWRISISEKPNEFTEFFETKHKWEGLVVEDPDIRSKRQLITFQPFGHSQRILLTLSKGQKFFYGDWVMVEGKIKQAKAFNDFDYPGFLERFNVYGVMSYPKVLILKHNKANSVKFYLLKLKEKFSKKIAGFLEEPENSLALGILIGAKKSLPADVMENFNITGTSHIVALSGFNITIIVVALGFLAWVAGRKASFWISVLIIAGFVVITGGSASVIRAGIMGGLLLLGFQAGRLYSVLPALLFAAAIMLAINPKILYWDVGFQLSFAATLGLVIFMPTLEKLTQKWPKLWGAKSIFFATIVATVSTLPLVLFYFGRLSLVSLLANLLILPVVPMAMLFGFLIVLPFFAPGFALIAGWLLAYIIWVAQLLASVPFSSIDIKIGPGILFLMLFALWLLYFGLKRISIVEKQVVHSTKNRTLE